MASPAAVTGPVTKVRYEAETALVGNLPRARDLVTTLAVAEIEAVLGHRRTLVAARTLVLHHVGDQIAELPTEIRDQISADGKIESRLRRLEHVDPAECSTPARWCGTGAVALSSGESNGDPVKHRLEFRGNRRVNSVLHIASVTQFPGQSLAYWCVTLCLQSSRTGLWCCGRRPSCGDF